MGDGHRDERDATLDQQAGAPELLSALEAGALSRRRDAALSTARSSTESTVSATGCSSADAGQLELLQCDLDAVGEKRSVVPLMHTVREHEPVAACLRLRATRERAGAAQGLSSCPTWGPQS